MNHDAPGLPVKQTVLAALCLVAIHQTAPVLPGLQAVLHVVLVVGIAPAFRSFLVAALWGAAAGWVMEGALRLYPHMGGTALANITLCVAAHWALRQWPPRDVKPFLGRLGILAVLHMLLVHGTVRFVAGPQPWGWGWLWTLLSLPLWGVLAFRLIPPPPRR